jgi:hypothetical protein
MDPDIFFFTQTGTVFDKYFSTIIMHKHVNPVMEYVGMVLTELIDLQKNSF